MKRFLFIRPSPPHNWSTAFQIGKIILWADGWPFRCGIVHKEQPQKPSKFGGYTAKKYADKAWPKDQWPELFKGAIAQLG